jgi:flagellar assembly protein FliH
MNARLDLAGTSVLPFQFPSLREEEAAPQASGVPVPPAALPASDAALESPDETAPPNAAAEQAEAEISAEFAGAREEGFRRGLEEGREQGYAAGFAEGAKAGEAKVMQEAERLAAIVARLGAPLTALERPVEEAVAALALEVARCVIGDGVKRSREFLARLVREAIAKVPLEMGAPRVLLNPADLDLIRKLVPEIDTGNAVLVGDDTIEPGGAIVVADGAEKPIKDRRWNLRSAAGASQVNLTLASRWREVMLALFDGEDG